MKLTLQDVTQKKNEFEKAGNYNCVLWILKQFIKRHLKSLYGLFGAGNIFRGYIAGLQEDLLNKGAADRGIIAQRLLIMISSIRSTSHMSQ